MIIKPLRKTLRLLPVLLSVAVTVGCNPREDEAQKAPSVLRIQADNLRPSAFTTRVKVTVYCDITWSADLSDKSWAKIENLVRDEGVGGSFTVTLSPNSGKGPREVVVKVTAGKGETTATLTQEGLESFFQPSTITLVGTGNSSVTFTSPYDWTAEIVSGSEWFNLRTSSGKAGSATLTCYAKDANENVGSREGAVRVKIGTVSVDIPVVQGQKDVILGEEAEAAVDWKGGTITVHTQSNVDYRITCDADWVVHTETRALNEATEVFQVQPNETSEKRTATIWFSGGNGAALSVQVTQGGKDPLLDVSQPGFYRLNGQDYVHGEAGWNQLGRRENPNGSMSFRLMNRADFSVLSVEGIPASVTEDSEYSVVLQLQKKDRIVHRETYAASVISTSEELVWMKTDSGIWIIIKK